MWPVTKDSSWHLDLKLQDMNCHLKVRLQNSLESKSKQDSCVWPVTRYLRYQYPTNMICFFETISILHMTISRYQYNTNTMTSSGYNTNTNISETLFAIPWPIQIPHTYFFPYKYRYDTGIKNFRFQYWNCADADQYRTALLNRHIHESKCKDKA